jgi:phosphoglycerol transferase
VIGVVSVLRRLLVSRAAWGAALSAVIALLAASWALELWKAHATIPLRYSSDDDTMFYLAVIKGIINHGWLLVNHNLGAPYGQQLFDYPQTADNLNFLLIKALATIYPNVGFVANAFFLLSFPLDALAAYAVLRALGVSRGAAVLCSVLFALLPYHFFRSDSHMMLSAYYALPLEGYLFIQALIGQPLFVRGQRSGWRAWLTKRTVVTLLICVVVASTGLYYAVFGLLLVLAGALLSALARRKREIVRSAFAACALIAAILAVNLAPTIVYHFEHGGNPQLKRSASVGDQLALSMSYLVLPPWHDRIAPLRNVTNQYAQTTPPRGYCEQCYESVGTAGDVGLLWLALVALGSLISAPLVMRRAQVHRAAALGVVICLAIGVTSGLSSLSRVFASADIRGWNRLSAVIAFFSLLALGLLLDGLRRRVARLRGELVWGVGLAAILVFGILDQTSSFFVPPYTTDASQYHSDGTFVAAIEHRLPPNAAVFQLPYVPYPEGYQPYSAPGQTIPFAPGVSFEYAEAREYVHSNGLSWSYGALKGRATNWEAELASKPVSVAVAGAAAAGFDGLAIDPRGYPGALSGELRRSLRTLLGVAPLYSPARDLVFYDLRPFGARLRRELGPARSAALRTATLSPIRMRCAPDRLSVVNPSLTKASVTLIGTVDSGRRVSLRLRLAPGASNIALGPLLGSSHGRLVAPALIDDAFAPFERGPGSRLMSGIVGPPCAQVTL